MAAAAGGGFATIGARAVFAGVADFLTDLENLGTRLGGFADSGGLSRTKERLADVSAGFKVFNKAIQETEAAVGAIGTAVGTITAPFRAVGSAAISAAGEVVEGSGKIVGALGDVANATAGISEKGVLGLAAVGGAITTLAVTAVTESARYERGMKDIEAVSQVTGPALDSLDIAIRRVGTSFPASIDSIQRAALELSKAGVPIKDISGSILDLTIAVEQLAGGELSAEGAAEAIGSNLRLFSKSFSEAGDSADTASSRIINAIQAVANKTRASSAEVITGIVKLGPNIAPLGGTVEETAALLGTVVGQGVRGQEAGTGLANFIQRLEAPSAQAREVLKRRNISLFDTAGEARPVIDVINDLSKTYGTLGREANGISKPLAAAELATIAQTRVLRTLNLVLDDGVASYKEYLDEIANTDVIKQAATQNEALLRQLGILVNNARLAGVSFGQDFVSGLGGATTALNAFLRDGERAQAVAGVLGKATASVLTGQGQDQARAAVSDSPFGEEGVRTFDAFNAASEKIRGNIEDLIRDAGQLGKTLGLISFPDGVEGAVTGAADAVSGLIGIADAVVKAFNDATPEIVKDLQEITGASSFEELISNVQTFGKELLGVFQDNGGEQSFDNAKAAGVSFLKTLRQELGPTVIEIAKLARAIEDNLPAFLALGEAATRAAGIIIRAFTLVGIGITNSIGGPLLLFERLFSFVNGLPGGSLATLNAGTDARAKAAIAAAAPVSTTEGSSRIAAGLGIAGIGQPGRERANPVVLGPAEVRTPAEMAQTASAIDAETGALASLTQANDEATQSQTRLNQEVGLTEGQVDDELERMKQAAAADKALEGASKSLGSAMRTLDKDIGDVQGSFDKTVEGARQRWLDGLDQIAEATKDAFERITRTAKEGRDKAIESFNLNVERGGGFFVGLDESGQAAIDTERGIVVGFNTAFKQGQEDQKRELTQGLEDRVTLRHQFQEDDTRDVARHNEDLTRLEQQAQENLSRTRQRGIDDAELQRTRAQERELLTFSRGQEREGTAFQRGQEQAATARQQAREDARASEDLNRSLSAATTPEQRTSLLTQFTESRRRTAQQRADQISDTQFSRSQQDALTSFRQGQEDKLTKERQKLEDANISHRRDLEVSDIQFRRELEVGMVLFRQGLEDKESLRRRTVAALEVAQTRREQLGVLGFDRTQQQEAQLFALINTTIPDLQRQLAQINQQEVDQIKNAAETAARGALRAGLTYNREIQAADVTSEEARRRLRERFNNEAQNIRERVPEGTPQRDEVNRQIEGQRAVLEAGLVIAGGRQRGQAAGLTGQVDETTQRLIDQLSLISPNVSGIASIFGQQNGAVSTPLIATPQVDRLTKAIEDLTTKIDKVKPGVHVDTVEQTIEAPTTPAQAIIGFGTIVGVV